MVTGAAAGLGRAEALGLARLGATVVVNDIAAALDASDVIDEISAAGAKAVAVTGDISQRATADELVSRADGLGGLDIVVNNAGITRDRMLFNMSDEEWDLVIAVHLRGHFLLTRNAATYWRSKATDAGGSIFGRIVNTSSEAGLVGPVGQANYGAAKAGITALTMTAARGLERYGVRANAICPRARTAMTADVFGPQQDRGRTDRPAVAGARGEAGPVSGVPGGRAEVNGQVFIVYGPRVTLVAAPTVEHRFSADGAAWEPAQLGSALGDYFAGRGSEKNFSAVGGCTHGSVTSSEGIANYYYRPLNS